MAAEDITLDELEAAFRDAGFTGAAGDAGKTSQELASAWGCSHTKAMKMLGQASRLGVLRTGRKRQANIAGNQHSVPVYSFVFAKPAAKKKK